MKILIFLFLSLIFCDVQVEKRVGISCGCGSIDTELAINPYENKHVLLYHQVLK